MIAVPSCVRRLTARLALTLCLTAGAAMAAPAPAHAELIDRIAAIVGDDIVTLSDVYRLMPIYAEFVGADLARLTGDDELQEFAREVLDFLIDARLLQAQAVERDLAITDDEVDQYMAQQFEAMGLTQEQYVGEMERQGIAEADFREMIAAHLTRLRMIQLDVLSELSIPDSEIDQIIAERYPDGLFETFLSSSHILVAVPRGSDPEAFDEAYPRIEGLYRALQNGQTFEAIASQFNGDGSRNTGGRLGTFRASELDQDYVRAALALEVGEVSEPVRSQFGWHIIRLDGVERREIEDPEVVRDQIYGELQGRYAEERSQVYLERLRSEAYVNVLIEVFP